MHRQTACTIARSTHGDWDQRRFASQLGLGLGLANLYAQLAQPLAEHAPLADLIRVERTWDDAARPSERPFEVAGRPKSNLGCWGNCGQRRKARRSVRGDGSTNN